MIKLPELDKKQTRKFLKINWNLSVDLAFDLIRNYYAFNQILKKNCKQVAIYHSKYE